MVYSVCISHIMCLSLSFIDTNQIRRSKNMRREHDNLLNRIMKLVIETGSLTGEPITPLES